MQTISPPPIHIVTQLWGESYVNLYANYVLESLASDGNLPALRDFPDIVYEIYTTPADKTALEANANFNRIMAQIKKWMVVRFVLIEDMIENSYALMSACHRQAITAAESRDAAILFLQPDVVVGNNSLRTVRDKIFAGKRLIMTPGLRTVREEMQAGLERYIGVSGTADFMPTRELVALGVSNLHPISRSLFWRNGQIGSYCSHLYWQLNHSSVYARCAHMHPLMVYPKIKNCGFDHTIDWDYFDRACPNMADWYVAKNSDEICLLELSGFTKFEGSENWKPAKTATIVGFLDFAARDSHIALFGHHYLFNGAELSSQDWLLEHTEANEVIKAALGPYRSLYGRTRRKIRLAVVRLQTHLFKAKFAIDKSDNYLLSYAFYAFYIPIRFIWRLKDPKRLRKFFFDIKNTIVQLLYFPLNFLFSLVLYSIYSPFRFILLLVNKLINRFKSHLLEIKTALLEIKNIIDTSNSFSLKLLYNVIYYSLRFVCLLKKRISHFPAQLRSHLVEIKNTLREIRKIIDKSDNFSLKIAYSIIYYPLRMVWRLMRPIHHSARQLKRRSLEIKHTIDKANIFSSNLTYNTVYYSPRVVGQLNKQISYSIRKFKMSFLEMKNTVHKSNHISLKLAYNTVYYSLRMVWRLRKRIKVF